MAKRKGKGKRKRDKRSPGSEATASTSEVSPPSDETSTSSADKAPTDLSQDEAYQKTIPKRSAQQWFSIVIVLFLASQIIMPVSYYLSDRVYDERFAWRMFSTVRMLPCRSQWTQIDNGRRTQIQPHKDVHYAWIELFNRVRMPVIEAYAERRCAMARETSDNPDVRVAVTCRLPDGELDKPMTPDKNLCEDL